MFSSMMYDDYSMKDEVNYLLSDWQYDIDYDNDNSLSLDTSSESTE